MVAGSTSHDLDVLRALIGCAEKTAPQVPAYIRTYLSDHARAAGPQGWALLARHPHVLAMLDPLTVATDVARTEFDQPVMPVPVAATVLARSVLATASDQDRPGLGALFAARVGGSPDGLWWGVEAGTAGVPDGLSWPSGSWSVRCAILSQQSPSFELRASEAGIRSVTAYVESKGALRLAVGDTVGIVRIWDPVTGTVLATLRGHEQSVRASVVITDRRGQFLITGGEDGTIRCWDLARRRLDAVELVGAPIWALEQADDGQVVSGAFDGSVRLWRLGGDAVLTQVGALPVPGDSTGAGRVDALVVHDGVLVVGRHDGRVECWELGAFESVSTPEPFAQHTRDDGGVRALGAITLRGPGGPEPAPWMSPAPHRPVGSAVLRILIGYSDDEVLAWNLDEPAPQPLRSGLSTRSLSILTLDDGAAVVLGDRHDVVLLDPDQGVELARLAGHTRDVRCSSAFSGARGGLLFATGAEDGSVRCWMPWSRSQTTRVGAIRALLAVPNGESAPLLVAGGPGRMLAFANGLDQEPQHWFYHHDEVTALAQLRGPDGGATLVSGGGRSVQFHDVTRNNGVQPSPVAHQDRVSALCATRGGEHLVSGDAGGWLIDWRISPHGLPEGVSVNLAPLQGGIVSLTSIQPAGRERLLAATSAGLVYALDPGTLAVDGVWSQQWWPREPAIPITAMTSYLSWKGTPLIVVARTPQRRHQSGEHRPLPVDRRSELLLVDPEEGLIAELLAHAGIVRALAIVHRPDGSAVLVSGDGDGRIAFSDPDKGYLITAIETGLPVLAIAGVGDSLAVGTSQGLVILGVDALRTRAPTKGAASVDWRHFG